MANQITGKVIAISEIETLKSNDPNKQSIQKRKLFLDCTRYDQYTGERGYENTPLLEFGGKALEKLNSLVDAGLKKDDIVTVSFDIQGRSYKDKDNKSKIFTSVRPYDIEIFTTKSQQAAQPAEAPTPDAQDGNDLPF